MAETQSFATKADYEDRYGSGIPGRVEVLLQDASALLRSNFIAYHQTAYKAGLNPRFDANACAVTCAIVARAINVPSGFEGASQYSQQAGVYQSTLTFANPTADLYITRSERARLGLSGIRIGSIQPMGKQEHEVADGSY